MSPRRTPNSPVGCTELSPGAPAPLGGRSFYAARAELRRHSAPRPGVRSWSRRSRPRRTPWEQADSTARRPLSPAMTASALPTDTPPAARGTPDVPGDHPGSQRRTAGLKLPGSPAVAGPRRRHIAPPALLDQEAPAQAAPCRGGRSFAAPEDRRRPQRAACPGLLCRRARRRHCQPGRRKKLPGTAPAALLLGLSLHSDGWLPGPGRLHGPHCPALPCFPSRWPPAGQHQVKRPRQHTLYLKTAAAAPPPSLSCCCCLCAVPLTTVPPCPRPTTPPKAASPSRAPRLSSLAAPCPPPALPAPRPPAPPPISSARGSAPSRWRWRLSSGCCTAWYLAGRGPASGWLLQLAAGGSVGLSAARAVWGRCPARRRWMVLTRCGHPAGHERAGWARERL